MTSKRIVLKFGTGILASQKGNMLVPAQFERLAADVSELVRGGHECILVSSGAVAAGLGALGLKTRPTDLGAVQACSAVGQSKLMQLYETMFAAHKLNVAQLLLTHEDLDSRMRHRNVKNTLERLLQTRRVVPIINENDTVAVEELKFGDNDRLSAEVAMLAGADLLILLTSVDGLHDSRGKRVAVVSDIEKVTRFARKDKGKLSVGGMISKLDAVRIAVKAGIPTVVASGMRAGQLPLIVAGRDCGTRFTV